MIGDDVLDLPVVELAAQLDAGAVRATELTDAYLARIDKLGPGLNCFITVTAERARADAARADAERAAGKRGPLLGVPYALKDLIDTAGITTTWGAAAFLDRVPERDARPAARLREAGAVLLGKLSMTELANAYGVADHRSGHNGGCRNPWDRARWAGGSSSGSGSAIAAGLCGFALGSETWGSIDCPAAYCGVTGLRPTYDVVSREGAMALSWTLDKVGVLARDARDTAAVLGVIAEAPPDGLDRVTPGDGAALRIGVVDQPDVAPDPAYPPAWEAAKQALRAAGATLTPLTLPSLPRVGAMITILLAEREVAFEDLVRSGAIDRLYDAAGAKKDRADYAKMGLRAEDYVKANAVRALAQRAYRTLFESVDVIVAPGRPEIAPLLTERWKDSPPNASDNLNADGNLIGLPQLTVPMGFTSVGLPLSLQVVAAPYEDAKAIAVASLFQASTAHHRRRPPSA